MFVVEFPHPIIISSSLFRLPITIYLALKTFQPESFSSTHFPVYFWRHSNSCWHLPLAYYFQCVSPVFSLGLPPCLVRNTSCRVTDSAFACFPKTKPIINLPYLRSFNLFMCHIAYTCILIRSVVIMIHHVHLVSSKLFHFSFLQLRKVFFVVMMCQSIDIAKKIIGSVYDI